MGNYHWYLKQSLTFSYAERVLAVAWHSDRPLLYVATADDHLYRFEIDATIHRSRGTHDKDQCLVGVIDNRKP